MDAFACGAPCLTLCMRLHGMTHTVSWADFGGYVGMGSATKAWKIAEEDSCTGEARFLHRCLLKS